MSKANLVILTHKLGSNYGGIAQAYALQKIIKGLTNKDVATGHLQPSPSTLIRVRSSIYQTFKRKTLYISSQRSESLVAENTNKFIKRHINLIDIKIRSVNAEHYVVGSDQVWRSSYVNIRYYLLSFVKSPRTTRVSYAASFGKDNLDEYSPSLIKKSKKLAEKFVAISVREDSGVDIVKKHWGLEAEHHVDPTLLLDADHYSELIENPSTPLPEQKKSGLFVYVLDNSKESLDTISKLADKTNLKPHRLIAKDGNDGEPLPPVEQWLRSFRDADFVVTDSFHGTVFSIIFNKPFISIGNKDRGLARFTSLLKMFDLTDRLVTSSEDITPELLSSEIDWKKVNSRIKEEQARSINYLKTHLSVKDN